MERSYSEEPLRPRSTGSSQSGTPGGGPTMGYVSGEGFVSTSITGNQAKVQLMREKKSVEGKARAIENRIRHFKREEEKIWRDLEEVRRQAAAIEDGKTRKDEKNLAERTILQARQVAMEENKVRAAMQKQVNEEQRARNAAINNNERQRSGQMQRKISQGILRQKRAQEDQSKWHNEERVLQMQHAKLEAKTKAHQEKMERFQKMKAQQEAERRAAEYELDEAAACIPSLEAEESQCIERLHNSRRVTQSVLEELEASLGSRSSLTSLLRSKSTPLEPGILEEDFDAEQDFGQPARA